MWQIKQNYQQREQVEYYEQKTNPKISQPHIYAFAKYLCERSGAEHIIDIGCGNGLKLKNFPCQIKKIGVDIGTNLDMFQQNNSEAKVLDVDLEKESPPLDDEILEKSVVICADVLEHLRQPAKLLKYLSILSYQALFVLVSTPDRVRLRGIGNMGPPLNPWHLREWNTDELHALFQEYGFKPGFWGYSVNNNEDLIKATSLYIGGRLNGYETKGTRNLKAVAVMSVFNEIDIVVQSIRHYLKQGLHVHVIDNWSDNGTYEIVQALAKNTESVTFERFPPEENPKSHVWQKMLDRKAAYAAQSGFDWAVHVDVDELRFSPWPAVKLLDAIKIVDALGFNAIDFTMFEFRPTKPGFSKGMHPKLFFKHFEFAKVPGAFIRINAWKIYPDICYDLSSKGGHQIQFPGQKVFPLKFETHHFAYRSLEQIRKKIYKERLPRIDHGLTTKGWHLHFIEFAVTHGAKLWKSSELLPDSVLTRENYIIERLSGIGLPVVGMDKEKNKRIYTYLKSGKEQNLDDLTVTLINDLESSNIEVKRLQQDLDVIKRSRSYRLFNKWVHLRNKLVYAEQMIRSIFKRS